MVAHPGLAWSLAGATPASLSKVLEAHLNQPRFGAAQWGVKIVSLNSGAVWFEHHSNKLLKPASNAKLFTAALALSRLGPDFRIRTSLLAANPPDGHGRLHGDLAVLGRGDPTFTIELFNGASASSLDSLARVLHKAGVRSVRGELVGDETFFSGPPQGSGWTWDDLQYYYGAVASALTANNNVVEVRVSPGQRAGIPCRIDAPFAFGLLRFVNRTRTVAAMDENSEIRMERPIGENQVFVSGQLRIDATNWLDAVTLPDPGLYFVTAMQKQLSAAGVKIRGGARVHRSSDAAPSNVRRDWIEIASVDSSPLREIVPLMLKSSHNLSAQLLLLQVGKWREVQPQPASASIVNAPTTEALGIVALREFLSEMGIDPNQVLLEEGAGLSRTCLVTPGAIVDLLMQMNRSPLADLFRSSLPRAGLEGTMRTRLAGPATAGKVWAKTGSLRHVSALSGYFIDGATEPLAFSIILNAWNPGASDLSARAEVDALFELLAQTLKPVESTISIEKVK